METVGECVLPPSYDYLRTSGMNCPSARGLAAAALAARRIIGDDVEGASVELLAAKPLDRLLGGVSVRKLNVGEAFRAAAAVVDDLDRGGLSIRSEGVPDLDLSRFARQVPHVKPAQSIPLGDSPTARPAPAAPTT